MGEIIIKIWVDDVRPAPDGYIHCRSVNETKTVIRFYERNFSDDTILIDLDHDSGDYFNNGGDYIKILNWLEEENIVDTGYLFHLHTRNPVGAKNMRQIIEKNKWKEVW